MSYVGIVLTTRFGDIAVIAPFRYSCLVFALLIRIRFLGEGPDALTFLVAALVNISVLYFLA